MGDDETEENNAGDGHDGFFADGGLPEAQIGGRKINGRSAHRMDGSLWLLKRLG